MLEEHVGGVVQARNVWSPVYVNALVLRDQSSQHNGVLDQRLYVQQDANWNVTALVDTSGNVVERYAYDPYGAVTVLNPDFSVRGSSAYAMPYLWQGERYDAVVKLYQLGGRVESPALMRFLQTDPSGFGGGDVNFYRDTFNSPTDNTDPTGLMPNQTDAISLDQFSQLVWAYEMQHIGEPPEAILDGLVSYFKDQLGWKYVYTTKYGWVDIPHFLTTANYTVKGVPPSVVELGGILQEYNQSVGWWFLKGYSGKPGTGSGGNYHSGFTVEDVPSNRLGIHFARQWNKWNVPLVSVALTNFLSSCGGMDVPMNSPAYLNLPKDETTWHQIDPKWAPYHRAWDYTISPYGLGSDLQSISHQAVKDYWTIIPERLRVPLLIRTSRFSSIYQGFFY